MTEIPFLEIPEALSSLAGSGEEMDGGLDLFDISYVLGLTESAGEHRDAEKHLVFTLDEDTFGIPLGNVVEVCRSQQVTSLPNSPQWLAGVTNMRGNLLSVITLHQIEGLGHSHSRSKMIVLVDDKDKLSIGLLVDQVIEISSFERENVLPFSSPKVPGARHFSHKKTQYKDSALLIMDMQKLFTSLEAKDL